MEAYYYPVVVIEDQDELEVITAFCEEHKISFQFLDNDLNNFPAQMLLYCDREDFSLFLERV